MKNTQTKKVLVGLWFLVLWFPVLSGAEVERLSVSQSKSQADFVLSVHGDLISLKAENASLKVVLEAIGQKMHIEVLGEIQEGETITTEFTKLPLAEALERLSPNYGYQMRTEKGEQKISKILVLPNPKGFVRPQPAVQATQIVEPSAAPDLAVAEQLEKSVPDNKEDEPTKEKPPRPEPFKFQFDPSALLGK